MDPKVIKDTISHNPNNDSYFFTTSLVELNQITGVVFVHRAYILARCSEFVKAFLQAEDHQRATKCAFRQRYKLYILLCRQGALSCL